MPRVGCRHRPLGESIASVVEAEAVAVTVVGVEGGSYRGWVPNKCCCRWRARFVEPLRRWIVDCGMVLGRDQGMGVVSQVLGQEGGFRSLKGVNKVNWQKEEESTEPSQNTTTPSPLLRQPRGAGISY